MASQPTIIREASSDVNPTFRTVLAILKASTPEQQDTMRRLSTTDDGKHLCQMLNAAYDQLHADMESAAYPQVVRVQSHAQAVRALALFIATGGNPAPDEPEIPTTPNPNVN